MVNQLIFERFPEAFHRGDYPTTRKGVVLDSGTARAMNYTLKRLAALVRYADAGNLPIDTIRWKTPSVLSLWARRTGCLPVASGPLPFNP
jgi:hypothetical protein